jgi:glucokinase
MLLAGDIGGTKTVLGTFSAKAGPRAPLAEATFPSARYASLEALVREFLGRVSQPVDRASFGVAGPVVSGRAAITNLPWAIDESRLREALRLTSVRVVNDLNAVARAVPLLEQADTSALNAGEPVAGGAIAVIAPGTGLGEAFLTWEGSRYRTHSSEGGHADFAPTDARQLDLLRYLQQRFGHVSYERVCSGLGLPNLYAYLKDIGYASEPSWLAEGLAAAADPTPVIVDGALAGAPCELCVATLQMFVSILGAEAGNLTLKVLATGGIYLGGGIPPRILPFLRGEGFMRAFRGKGRLGDLLGRVPVHVILNPKAGLFGAAAHGLEQWEEGDNDRAHP